MFPVEIWEEILQHIDPVELTRLKAVCRSWYAIAPRILQNTDAWYSICKRDICQSLWCLIFEQQNHPDVNWRNFHSSKSRPNVWAALYKSWINWHRLSSQCWSVQSFLPVAEHRPLENIICVAALSNIIAVCTSEGYIIFQTIAGEKMCTTDHGRCIRDAALWRNSVGDIIVTTSAINGRINHWNLHDKVLESCSHGTFVCSSFQYCFTLLDHILYLHKTKRRGKRIDEDRYEIPVLGTVVAVWAERNVIVLWVREGRIYSLLLSKHGVKCSESTIPVPKITIRWCKIFVPLVFCCLGELGEFGFSVRGREWKIYDVFPKLFSPVTAILFHVGVLVLGLDTGEVYLFPIDDADQLENLDFEKMKSRKLCLDSRAIISLNAVEHDSTHYLIAATKRNLHIVKFFWKIYTEE